jgi:predicted dehydrogenase
MALKEELAVGIAGTGFIGAVHARSARLAGGRLVGVAASSPQRAAEAADGLGAERAFDSAQDLVEAEGIDVVHICTPNNLHLPLAEAALRAGKHVVCEKPLATDVAGAQRLVDASRAARTQDAVPFVYRYYPTVREARERVRSGKTGALRLLHGTYLQDWLLEEEDDNWRIDEVAGGPSRAFADIGSHWCDLAEFISGHRITRLCATTATAHPERPRAAGRNSFETSIDAVRVETRKVETEDAAIVQFATDKGGVGSVVISQVSPGRKNRLWLELDGATEALAFDQEHPEILWCGRRESATLLRRDPASMTPQAARLATLPSGHPQGYADCFDGFVADVYDAIRTGKPAEGMPAFSDGLRAATITEAVLDSAGSEGWVDVARAPAGVRG